MKTIEYYLMPKSGYEFEKTIPSFIELNKILKEGVYPRLVEWDPIEIDEY